ncbi:MAG: efflux RND transporter periplasmic adaptor subunit, partial [Duncaniella sp.]|nr:efflux RND transporter periplasmic adaptor subunit [Duncaniella sp.]
MKKIYPAAIAALMLGACTGKPDYDATGIFEATTVTISAETPGKILSMPVSEGDTISVGQHIAVVDTAILTLQKKQLLSQRMAAESGSPDIAAQAEALRTQIAHQQHECERFERLLADGATTPKQVADAQAQLNTLRGQLTALLSTLGKNRSSISDNAVAIQYQTEQIEEQIRKSTITAPLSGTILEKYSEPGEYATPGRPLCKVADLGGMYLRAYFTVSQLADIHIGQQVTVIADFGGDERYEYTGTIT